MRQTHEDWQKKKGKEFLNILEEEKEVLLKQFEDDDLRDKKTPPCVPGVA